MSLFKTIEEIKQFLPVTASFKFEEIKPFMVQVERNYIIPMVSKTQFDELNTAYNASLTPTLTPAQEELLTEIRYALTPLMYWLWIPHGQVKVSGAGIQITSTATQKTAFQWQVDKLEESAFTSGFLALETLLIFLEENKDTYTLWKASESYTISKELFINSAKQFNEQYPINNSRYLFLQIRAFSKIIERETIKGTLGKELYDLVKASLLEDAPDPDYSDLLEYIKPVIAFGTLLKASTRLSLIIDSKGVSIFNNNNSQTTNVLQGADDKRLQMWKEDMKYEFDSATQALLDYLNENHADYPEFPYVETNTSRFENTADNKFFYGGK